MPLCTEQQLLAFMRETAYKPMTYQELEKHFGIADAGEFKAFLRLLTQLEQEGQILLTRTERYGVPERMNLLRGRLQAHPKGFAFLITDEPDHPDVYIHANDLKSAMNGDTVLARVTSKSEGGSRLEGEIVRIVKRAVTQVVGLFANHDSFGFVVPDDKRVSKDIFIRQENFKGAVTGQKVVANIIKYPEGRSAAEGEIVEILGHKDDPGVDILSIIRKHGLPESFPDDVMAEAEAAPDSITEEEIAAQGRRDLRDRVIVTIDGEDAKDLDDAVNVELLPNGNWLLGVHIADVSYYVREKSRLDEEAFNRGTSVYLVDRVIPMLPHRLSNGICSLNPQVDRLTMSCEMEFEPGTMQRVRYDIFTSVIKTKERMTYTNVRKIVQDEDPEVTERYADLIDTFKRMRDLALALRSKRIKRGAIDFDFQESKVLVDENGAPVDIVKRERSIAEQMIEEFMLAANETVAEHFHWLKVPFLYRIHEEPDGEKLQHFMQFAANFGHHVRGGKGNAIHPRALQTLLDDIRGTKEETVISTMMLRSMKQAKYDAQSLGHFGLAAEFYSHFTSPIRRYPDLMIHRVIREVLENGGALPEGRFDALAVRMPEVAQHSSERERVAVDAERDTEKLKKAEFMLDKVGEEFDGIISGVTGFGMFIELENTVEGLIRLSSMADDYYHFHEQHMALVGERTSKVYRIGDEVRIRVARVNMDEHAIDFELVGVKARQNAGSLTFADLRGSGRRQSGSSGHGVGHGKGGRHGRDKSGRGKGGRDVSGENGQDGRGKKSGGGFTFGGPAGGTGGSAGGRKRKKRGSGAGAPEGFERAGAVGGEAPSGEAPSSEGKAGVKRGGDASGGEVKTGRHGGGAPSGGKRRNGGRMPEPMIETVASSSGPRVKRKKGTDMWGLPVSGELSRSTDDGEGGTIGEPRKKRERSGEAGSKQGKEKASGRVSGSQGKAPAAPADGAITGRKRRGKPDAGSGQNGDSAQAVAEAQSAPTAEGAPSAKRRKKKPQP